MIYDFVPFHEVAGEIAKNLETHYNDAELKDSYGRPNLDWDNYLAQSVAGSCRAVTARDNGKLVGYSVFCVGVNINHKTIIQASNIGMFVWKKYRGKIAMDLIRNSDEFLRQIGVMEVMYVMQNKRLGSLLKRAKYDDKYVVWARDLNIKEEE